MNLDRSEVEKEAISYFRNGNICAEAVSKSIANKCNLDAETISGVATGFGGGMARHGYTCGALTGAIIAIGATINKGGRDAKDSKTKNEIYSKTQNLFQAFESKFNSVICSDLTNCNFLSEKGLKKFSDDKIMDKVCVPIVGWTTRYLENLIDTQ